MKTSHTHAFTVDVEDWFHILDCPQAPALCQYDAFESRVTANTDKLLQILANAEVTATFFVLGWVAARHPRLVRHIADAGHEIAVHGFAHTLAADMSTAELEADTRRAIDTVGNAAGKAPQGYRSPGGSLMKQHEWVFDLLLELGLRFDASLYPRKGGLLKPAGQLRHPYVIRTDGKRRLWEFPSSVRRCLWQDLAFAEGGYFRVLPYFLVSRWFRSSEEKGHPVSACIHPRELDPEHPRMTLSVVKRWRTYAGIYGAETKLNRLLGEALAKLLADSGTSVRVWVQTGHSGPGHRDRGTDS